MSSASASRENYRRRIGWARTGALAATLALLLIIACETLLMPSAGRQPNAVVWCALSLPLLILLPGLWRGGLRSYAWLSFVSLLYFAQAVTAVFAQRLAGQQAVAPPQSGFAPQALLQWLDLSASIALFVCTLLFVRWRARADRAAAPE